MMGKITPDKIATIDNKIISSLDKDKNTNKNIYLLTSEKDIQFPTEIHPNLIKFINICLKILFLYYNSHIFLLSFFFLVIVDL